MIGAILAICQLDLSIGIGNAPYSAGLQNTDASDLTVGYIDLFYFCVRDSGIRVLVLEPKKLYYSMCTE